MPGFLQLLHRKRAASAVVDTGITHVTSSVFGLAEGTSYTLNNVAVDDLICVHSGADIEGLSPGPTGYTELFYQRNPLSTVDQAIHYKVATSTSETISGFSAEEGSIVVSVFRGVDTTTPIHTYDTSYGNSGTPDPPSVTTTVDGCMILALMSYDDVDITSTLNVPSGYTLSDKFFDGVENTSTTATAYNLQSTAGAENPGTFSHSNADPAEPWCCATVALKPAGGGQTPLQYLSSTYSLDHWFATTEFNGASSDGDNITSWGDLVTTSNAAVGSSLNPNPILRVVGGRNYASFNEGTTRTVFVMPEATFSGVGAFDATVGIIFMKTANITSTSELGAYTKGKENAFATAENQLLLDSNSYTLRSQGTNNAQSHPLADGDYIVIRIDGTNTKLYTYDISATTLTERSSFTNGTSTDSGNLFFGGVEDEGGGTAAGCKWYCSDLLFFSQTMTTVQIEDVIDQIELQ